MRYTVARIFNDFANWRWSPPGLFVQPGRALLPIHENTFLHNPSLSSLRVARVFIGTVLIRTRSTFAQLFVSPADVDMTAKCRSFSQRIRIILATCKSERKSSVRFSPPPPPFSNTIRTSIRILVYGSIPAPANKIFQISIAGDVKDFAKWRALQVSRWKLPWLKWKLQ